MGKDPSSHSSLFGPLRHLNAYLSGLHVLLLALPLATVVRITPQRLHENLLFSSEMSLDQKQEEKSENGLFSAAVVL